jgi:hypothetical protein
MDVNIICGSRSIPWDRLLTFQNSVAYTACWNYPAHSIMSTQISSSLYTVLTLAYLRELSGLYRGRAPTLGLEDVLDRFSHTHCSVPLDLVYSVLNISNLAGSSIPINYGKTSMEVFSGITKMIIARSRNLIHLACTGLLYSGDVLKPPSWMRDYSRPELPSILVKTSDMRPDLGPYFSAAGGSVIGHYFEHESRPQVLHLKGAFHDMISTSTSALEDHDP